MPSADVPVPDFHTPGAIGDLRDAFDAYAGDLRWSERLVLSLKRSTAEWQLERGKTAHVLISLEGFAFVAERAGGEAGAVLSHQARRLAAQLE